MLKEFDSALIQRNLTDFRRVFDGLNDREKPQCIALILQQAKVYKDRMEVSFFDLPEFPGGSQSGQT